MDNQERSQHGRPLESSPRCRKMWRIVMLFSFVAPVTVIGADDNGHRSDRSTGTVLKDQGASGHRCLVCRRRITEGGSVLRHDGRRVHICSSGCLQHWHDDPIAYFAAIQARGALFDERTRGHRSLWSGWLGFGFYVLSGLICGAASSYLAVSKGHPPVKWFFLGFAFNVLGLCAIVARSRVDMSALPAGVPAGLRKVPLTRQPVHCEKCGDEHHPSAQICGSCGADLQPMVKAETSLV